MKVKPIEEIVRFLEPIAERMNAEIIDANWNNRDSSLNLFLDAKGGVDLNLLEAFHHAVDGPLDELDPTFGASYTLNCSSAGLDRPFKNARDYERHLGEKVEIRLYAPVSGKKRFEGELISFDGNTVKISDGAEREFPVAAIAKACLAVDI